MGETPSHYKGKDAVGHVAQAKARGIIASAEVHGTETPGHISAACDAARETAVILLILGIILNLFSFDFSRQFPIFAIFSLGWIFWKAGRSAWLAWSRLERMHRIVEQERWEIQHHRPQEREELTELYRAKGLEGKLLEDVIDVLMADEERLLRVMVEEELFLSLETQEHPLKQAIGAFLGVLFPVALAFLFIPILPAFGLWIASTITIIGSSWVSATYEGNKRIPAIVWNLGIAALTIGTIYILLDYVQ